MKIKNKNLSKDIEILIDTFLMSENSLEVSAFLQDLLTEREIKEFANRWKVARMLSDKISYQKIEDETGMSSTTIARISKWLQNGAGGYKIMLEKIKNLDRHK